MMSVNNKAMENIVNKITEFYAKVVADENYKVKFEEILNGKDITEATDEQLEKIGEIAKELDYDITLEEAKEFIKEGESDQMDYLKGENLVFSISATTREPREGERLLDLGSLASIAGFVDRLKADGISVDGLLNNAGTMEKRYGLNDDGLERVTATNYIGTYLLTRLMAFIYAFDTPTGVCPSLHVAYSMGIAAVWCRTRGASRPWKAFAVLSAVLISISTAFVKQHSVVDILAAIPVGALADYLVFGPTRLHRWIEGSDAR